MKSIWAASENSIFAVGEGGLILHGDGATWEQMDSGTTADLNGIRGVRGVRYLDEKDALELDLDEGADPHDVMRNVLDGHAMRSIELRRLSLNEVFVQLVRKDEGSDAAELAREELSHV